MSSSGLFVLRSAFSLIAWGYNFNTLSNSFAFASRKKVDVSFAVAIVNVLNVQHCVFSLTTAPNSTRRQHLANWAPSPHSPPSCRLNLAMTFNNNIRNTLGTDIFDQNVRIYNRYNWLFNDKSNFNLRLHCFCIHDVRVLVQKIYSLGVTRLCRSRGVLNIGHLSGLHPQGGTGWDKINFILIVNHSTTLKYELEKWKFNHKWTQEAKMLVTSTSAHYQFP